MLFAVTYIDLTLKNIKNFLTKNRFPSSDAKKLGEQLDQVSSAQIQTFISNHNNSNWDSILSDILNHWLNNDPRQSWKKLGEALLDCGHKVAASNLGVSVNEEEHPITTRQRKSTPEGIEYH